MSANCDIIPSAKDLARDARWLAQAADPAGNAIRVVEMTREEYRAASFLDDRLFQAPMNAHVLPFADVAGALGPEARGDARWIFHIGHVGSTLISRLLGELEDVLAVREPRLLRDLAALPRERREVLVPVVQKLFSRSFAESETAVVKATSFVSELAAELVPPEERALFVYVDAPSYVATILAGENSVRELRALAPVRATRLEQRGPRLQIEGTDADLAAVAWACEMTALESAAAALGQRLLWVDFDALLRDVPAALAQLANFFGLEASPDRIQQIGRGPLMSRYSKALEFDYSPSLRRELIEEACKAHGPQIEAALAMLDRSAQESPLLARALARARPER